MTTYIIRRLIHGLVVLIILTVFIFLLMRILPGDPVTMYISRNQLQFIGPEELAAIRAEFGLDKPLPMQYVDWIYGILRGDLGRSIFWQKDVTTLIGSRLPVTLQIGMLSWVLGAFLGIVAGTVCAIRRGTKLDTIVTTLANIGVTIPSFWLGILLIYFFALKLNWLPTCGVIPPWENPWLHIRQLIMPVLAFTIGGIAMTARQTRSSILEVVQQDYVRTAWSKGLTERAIILRHILKNGLIPVITLEGMYVSVIFGGSVIIETVFNIPGMGRLMVEAVFAHDYPIVQGIALLIGLIVVLANLLVDISYAWLDPRIRLG